MPTFAAIDIGSNSVRLKIARLQAGRLKKIHEDREVTRLGEGVFSGGLLSPESMSQTVRVLRRFNRAIQECGTDSVRGGVRRGGARRGSNPAIRDGGPNWVRWWIRRRCAMPAIRAYFWSGCARRRAGRSKSFPDWKRPASFTRALFHLVEWTPTAFCC